MNQTYKLMAVDMDGTLLTSQKGILPETLKDIRLAAGTGKEIALCTGRGVAEISEFSGILKDIRYAVNKHCGFSASCSGKHQYRSFGRFYSFKLFFV